MRALLPSLLFVSAALQLCRAAGTVYPPEWPYPTTPVERARNYHYPLGNCDMRWCCLTHGERSSHDRLEQHSRSQTSLRTSGGTLECKVFCPGKEAWFTSDYCNRPDAI